MPKTSAVFDIPKTCAVTWSKQPKATDKLKLGFTVSGTVKRRIWTRSSYCLRRRVSRKEHTASRRLVPQDVVENTTHVFAFAVSNGTIRSSKLTCKSPPNEIRSLCVVGTKLDREVMEQCKFSQLVQMIYEYCLLLFLKHKNKNGFRKHPCDRKFILDCVNFLSMVQEKVEMLELKHLHLKAKLRANILKMFLLHCTLCNTKELYPWEKLTDRKLIKLQLHSDRLAHSFDTSSEILSKDCRQQLTIWYTKWFQRLTAC